jgi:hypothetical protein
VKLLQGKETVVQANVLPSLYELYSAAVHLRHF